MRKNVDDKSKSSLTPEQTAIINGMIWRHVRKVFIGYVILVAGIGWAIHEGAKSNSATHSLATESAITRVKTVKQRCELTKLLAYSVPAPSVKPALLVSYKGCEKQLKEVKKIAKGAK